jgi:hypothetical protein
MYIDDVATGRSDVARPWREHRERAGSYFAWSFGLTLATLMGILALVVPAVFVVVRLDKRGFRAELVLLLALLVLFAIVLVVIASLASLALRDFVAPLQWALGVPCGAAFGVFFDLLRAHPGAFLVYVLLKIAFGIALGLTAVVVGCLTCCLGFLPVVSHTVLQPALFFERGWSLFLLRQLGHDVIRASAGPAQSG